MQKKQRYLAIRAKGLTKFLLLMKLSIIIILITGLQLSAKTYSQQRITLKVESVELKTALKQIEKKSMYRFLYNNIVLNTSQKVQIDANNALVTDVLTNLLTNTNLAYRILDNNLVVITQKTFITQDVKVTGKVTDASGAGVPGVSVHIKGSAVGTSTDASGNYAISAPDGARLVFSSVGYLTQEVAVNGRTQINVILQIAAKDINEVVVIGYGVANKRDLTGSIAKVAGKDIADKPNTNPIASLQGKVAGLSVVNNGTPGAQPDIRIRGTGSIGNLAPLYVVDGLFSDNIDYLNPNDIESIEVLKDASSLAIFGVKGANGVIAITTKKAKMGQTVINFNTTYGTKSLVNKIQMATASQFNTLFAEENANNNVATPNYSALTANTDWIGAVTRKAQFNTNNLSVMSTSERNKVALGLGYTYDEGIILNEKLQKYLLSFSDEFKLNKNIKIGVNFSATRQQDPYDATSILNQARQVMPGVSAGTKSFRFADPYTGDTINANIYSGLDIALQNSGVVNPLIQVNNDANTQKKIEERVVGSVYAEITFLKNFTFRATGYGDILNVDNRQYTPLVEVYDPIAGTPYLDGQHLLTKVVDDKPTTRKWQQDEILTFRKSYGKNNLTAMGGFTTTYRGFFDVKGTANQPTGVGSSPIPNDPRYWYLNTNYNNTSNTLATSSQTEATTVSELARVLYNYDNKYYFNASLRNDASSKLLPANRNQIFWAIGAAWELTKERFMQNIKYIDFLKLKASVGVLGNQSAVDGSFNQLDYPAYPLLSTGNGANFGTNTINASQPLYAANPNLKWETVNEQEVGIELNAFGNKLHFEANYFNKTTNNLMVYISRTAPLLPILENGGSLQNWGEEFSGSWNQKISKDFSVSVGGNITFLKNKVVSLTSDFPNNYISVTSQNNGSAESRSQVGHPIGEFYGYKVAGLYQSNLDILQSPSASSIGSYRPGDFKFVDVNGDGKITADDRTFIGNPTPKFTYGTYVNVVYKNFNLGIDMGGVYGNQIFRVWGSLESPFQRVNYAAEKMNRWHGAGTSNWTPIISQADRFNYNGSTYNLEDGSYFRIRNIQLGYNFSQRLIAKAKMKNLRAFVNLQNPITWKNNLGYTAEFGGNAVKFGYDSAGGAIPAVTTFGLNVTF